MRPMYCNNNIDVPYLWPHWNVTNLHTYKQYYTIPILGAYVYNKCIDTSYLFVSKRVYKL